MLKTLGNAKGCRTRRGSREVILLRLDEIQKSQLDTCRQLQGVVVLLTQLIYLLEDIKSRVETATKCKRPSKAFYAADGFKLDITE